MDWSDYTQGGLGAIMGTVVGSVLTVLGFRSRLDKAEVKQAEIEKDCSELKAETLAMFLEIRKDIKNLIERSGERRRED